MSLPTSFLSYATEFEALDRALADTKGIRINLGTYAQANAYRVRLHYARRLDRDRSKEMYKPGDPGYGTSSFDCIVCRLKEDTEGGWWVYLEKNEVIPGHVESLSGGAV